MQQLISNIDTVHAFIQSENSDDLFTAAVMSVIYQILAGFASDEQIYDV